MLIKDAKLHVGNGCVVENTDILIKNGIIEEIKPNISNNLSENLVIDCSGKQIFPGFIDPLTGFGCMDFVTGLPDIDDRHKPISPNLNTKYAVNPNELNFQELQKFGITRIGINPGNSSVVSGMVSVFKTYADNRKDLFYKECCALKGSVLFNVKDTFGKRNTSPMTKMSLFKIFEDYLKKIKKLYDENSLDLTETERRVFSGDVPFIISADTKQEIQALMEILKKYDIKPILAYSYDFDKCINEIMCYSNGLILGNRIPRSREIYDNCELTKINELLENDIPVAISSSSDKSNGSADTYIWNAGRMFKAGIDSENVLKMMTSNPAKLLGIDKEVGVIEVGKLADLLIYSDNPIEVFNAKLLYTIIEGNIVFSNRG